MTSAAEATFAREGIRIPDSRLAREIMQLVRDIESARLIAHVNIRSSREKRPSFPRHDESRRAHLSHRSHRNGIDQVCAERLGGAAASNTEFTGRRMVEIYITPHGSGLP